MKVLITGATGLLGGHLLQELQQRGEQIRALVLPTENAEKLLAQGVEVVRGDVTDADTLAPAVKDIELIFHLAGMMGVNRPLADYRLVNVTGSENLYRAAQAAGVRRFVHTSSHTVYGLGYGRFLTEEDALRDFVAWLGQIPIGEGVTTLSLQDFIAAVRASGEPSSPLSPPDFMYGSPPAGRYAAIDDWFRMTPLPLVARYGRHAVAQINAPTILTSRMRRHSANGNVDVSL